MKIKLNTKIDQLVKNFSKLEKYFNNTYELEPGLYLYKKLISKIRKYEIKILLEEKIFIELLYTTLWAWGMNIRGAKMKKFDIFYDEIKKNQKQFINLSTYQILELTNEKLTFIEPKIKTLYSNLDFMKSKTKITANSKVMHFILPDLIFPIDSKIRNFIGNFGGEKKGFYKNFLVLFEITHQINDKIKLREFIDKRGLNTSVPKIIDNIITSYEDIKKKETEEY